MNRDEMLEMREKLKPMYQLNQQIPEKPQHRTDGALEVHSIFYTIQGEGPFAGMPAMFVRTAGCNLQCPDCDTIYANKRTVLTPSELLMQMCACLPHRAFKKAPLVVITGGEPFRQNIWPAVRELLQNNWLNVQIETNGTLDWAANELPPISTTIVCSPKKDYVVPEVRKLCKHLKYVCQAGQMSEEDGLPLHTMGYGGGVCRPWTGFTGTVWLQPLDEQDETKNKANREAVVAACKNFGYRVSIQSHKILQVD
jgi:7-carboxy-7-deazaguanine synthase